MDRVIYHSEKGGKLLGPLIDGMLVGLWFLFLAIMAAFGVTFIYCVFVFAYWVAAGFAKWLGV